MRLQRFLLDARSYRALKLDDLRPSQPLIKTTIMQEPERLLQVPSLASHIAPRRLIHNRAKAQVLFVNDDAKLRILQTMLRKPRFMETVWSFLESEWKIVAYDARDHFSTSFVYRLIPDFNLVPTLGRAGSRANSSTGTDAVNSNGGAYNFINFPTSDIRGGDIDGINDNSRFHADTFGHVTIDAGGYIRSRHVNSIDDSSNEKPSRARRLARFLKRWAKYRLARFWDKAERTVDRIKHGKRKDSLLE